MSIGLIVTGYKHCLTFKNLSRGPAQCVAQLYAVEECWESFFISDRGPHFGWTKLPASGESHRMKLVIIQLLTG